MRVNIYLESSIRSPRRSNGVVGYVLEAEGHEDKAKQQYGRVINVTANQSILIDLEHALDHITKKTDITIWSDSTYLQSAFENGWLEQWKENGWKTNRNKEVANADQWEKILQKLDGVIPEFRTKESHSYKKYMKSEVKRREKRYV